LRLDVGQTRQALAIAASHASGLKENFGSMTKPYHAGHAARCGVLAAQLAREGLTASETALEGRQGYVAAFGGEGTLDRALDELGRTWQLLTSGIAVKHPETPLSPEALRAKFLACAARAIARDEAEGVAEQLEHLEDIPDLRALTSRLVGDLD